MADESNFEYILALKSAWYYYIENMTQQEIAASLGVSRMRVVKLLDYARHNGIIQFRFRSGQFSRMELEQNFKKRWKLRDVFIVPIASDVADVNESLGKAAAMYLADQIHEDCYVNWGHGHTLNLTLTNLLQMCDYHLSIIGLTGGVDYYLPRSQTSYSDVKLYAIPAPLIMSSAEAAAMIRAEKSVQEIFDMIWHASMTVVGIGGMNPSATLLKNGTMTNNDFLLLSMRGAVGDILSQFIDRNGEKVHSAFDDCMVSISLEVLRSLDNVIGIAGGVNKAAAIRATLEGGYLNRLIIDEETARLIMESEETPASSGT